MINFKQFIVESKSAPLYHVTRLKNFIQIESDGVLRAKIQNYASGDRKEARNGKDTIFFTRNLYNAKDFSGMRNSSGVAVILKFNQQKLAQKYKIQPIHNWSENYYKTATAAQKAIGRPYMDGVSYGSEFEEIIEKDIRNPLNYIDEVLYTADNLSSKEVAIIDKLVKKYSMIKWTKFIRN